MNDQENKREKRSLRDYNLGFKLSIVSQAKKRDFTYKQTRERYGIQGKSIVLVWLKKYGNLD